VYIQGQRGYNKTLCILDSAAGHSSIDAEYARELGLELGEPRIKTLNYLDRQAQVKAHEVTATLTAQDEVTTFHVDLETVEGFAKLCRLWPWSKYLSRHPHLKDIPTPEYPEPPTGKILIGADNVDLLRVLEYRRSKRPNRPMGVKTPLGWGFIGPDPAGRDATADDAPIRESPVYKMVASRELTHLVERQFEIENLGALEPLEGPTGHTLNGPKPADLWTPEEKLAEERMVVSKKIVNGVPRYEARMPWRDHHESALQGNFAAVARRQAGSHSNKALTRKGVLLSEIKAIIDGYKTKGYIEPVADEQKTNGWYLPFFEVVNRSKSTPIRLVFDAKAKYNGVSLNGHILDSPNRMNDLSLILTRMRRFKFLFAGDITEMFLQISLAASDRPFHRFTFQDEHYQFTRILFGNKASPNISQKVLAALCSDKDAPQASETIRKSCYMDDCIDSRDSEEEIAALARELPKLLMGGGMKICKIYCNSPMALKEIDSELLVNDITIEDQDVIYEDQKVLGMIYIPRTDNFTFKVRYSTLQEWKSNLGIDSWTKRLILKVTASHYDPLGLISPVTIRPRKLLQALWKTGIGWDDPVPETFALSWEATLEELLQAGSLTFDRWVRQKPDTEMHVYCDASAEVYATALYLRTVEQDKVHVTLLAAKARVTPIKSPSVSRSELDACVLGVRMARHYNQALGLDPKNIFYYTDSTNALCWILSSAKDLKVYTQRRVAEIQTATDKDRWGHVDTGVNPADVPTRDLTTEEVATNALWPKGPPQLSETSYEFKKFESKGRHVTPEYSAEVKTTAMYYHETEDLPWAEKLASHYSAGTQWNGGEQALRVLKRMMTRFGSTRDPRHVMWIASQQRSFSREIEKLNNGEAIRKGPLSLLNPFIDDNGLLRSRSRLERGESIPYDQKYPVILSAKSHVTRLIVAEYHVRYKHPVGTDLMRARLQKRFIILGLARAIRRLSETCITCRKITPAIRPPQMAPLPTDLLDPAFRCFKTLGIDHAGPFYTREPHQKEEEKDRRWYVLVFTCLQTRAVHFELCPSLSADATIQALVRFSSLRGTPKTIYSDNASGFHAARLKWGAHSPWFADPNPLTKELMQWKFIIPRAPHQGGRWERMVGSMKRALRAYTGSRVRKEDHFRTVLARAADILNSRPLLLRSQGELSDPLTPDHFLNPRVKDLDVNVDSRTGLQKVNERVEAATKELWELFTRDLLTQNRNRQTWGREEPLPQKGDLALLLEISTIGKSNWLAGIIEDVIKSAEGKICGVYIRTIKGIVNRSIQHVTIIPSDLPQREPEPDSELTRGPDRGPDLTPGNLDPGPDQPLPDAEQATKRDLPPNSDPDPTNQAPDQTQGWGPDPEYQRATAPPQVGPGHQTSDHMGPAEPGHASPCRAGPSHASPSQAGPSQAGPPRAGPSRNQNNQSKVDKNLVRKDLPEVLPRRIANFLKGRKANPDTSSDSDS